MVLRLPHADSHCAAAWRRPAIRRARRRFPATCVDSPRAVRSRFAWPRTRAARTTRCIAASARSSRARGSAWCSKVSATSRRAAVTNARRSAVDRRWEQPWGEQRFIQDRHNELQGDAVGRRRGAHRALRPRPFACSMTASASATSSTTSPPRATWPSSTSSPSSGSPGDCDAWWYPARQRRPRRISLQARAPVRAESRGNAADAAVAGPLSIHPRSRAGGLTPA